MFSSGKKAQQQGRVEATVANGALVVSHLGVAHPRVWRGNMALAHATFTRFLQLWSTAPELPEKADAKRRLDALLARS